MKKTFKLSNFVPYGLPKAEPVFFATVTPRNIRLSTKAIAGQAKYVIPMYSKADKQIALEMLDKAADGGLKVSINRHQAIVSCTVFLAESEAPEGRYEIAFETIGKRRFMVLKLMGSPVEFLPAKVPKSVKAPAAPKSETKPPHRETVRPKNETQADAPTGKETLPPAKREHRGAMAACVHPGAKCKPAFCKCRCNTCLDVFLSGKPFGEAA